MKFSPLLFITIPIFLYLNFFNFVYWLLGKTSPSLHINLVLGNSPIIQMPWVNYTEERG